MPYGPWDSLPPPRNSRQPDLDHYVREAQKRRKKWLPGNPGGLGLHRHMGAIWLFPRPGRRAWRRLAFWQN
jgi:hypothetical protein